MPRKNKNEAPKITKPRFQIGDKIPIGHESKNTTYQGEIVAMRFVCEYFTNQSLSVAISGEKHVADKWLTGWLYDVIIHDKEFWQDIEMITENEIVEGLTIKRH